MAEDMNTIPPRVNALEKELHTMEHRVSKLEDSHRDIPVRMTKVELATERLPQIERRLQEQGDMIKRGFTLTNGILMGAGAVWLLFQAGPEVLKLLGAR